MLVVNQLFPHLSINHGHIYLYAYQNRIAFQELFKYACAVLSEENGNGFKFDTLLMPAFGKGFKVANKYDMATTGHFEHFYFYNYEPKGSYVCISLANAPIV